MSSGATRRERQQGRRGTKPYSRPVQRLAARGVFGTLLDYAVEPVRWAAALFSGPDEADEDNGNEEGVVL